jgi:hypothetical protein
LKIVSVYQIKKDEMGDMWAHARERRGAYRVLDRKPEGKRQRGRYRCTRKNCVKRDLSRKRLGVWSGLIWHKIGANCGLL